MARRVFFSFHYDRDIWRASQIRNSWVCKPSIEEAGFVDIASWEAIEREGDEAVERWINNQLYGTSVTVVLIGAETAGRKWVNYEIKKSCERDNGMLGVYIHNCKDQRQNTDYKGKNPFDDWKSGDVLLSQMFPTYDWIYDYGYNHLGDWIEAAAQKAGR